jgi:hypothetical protein
VAVASGYSDLNLTSHDPRNSCVPYLGTETHVLSVFASAACIISMPQSCKFPLEWRRSSKSVRFAKSDSEAVAPVSLIRPSLYSEDSTTNSHKTTSKD